MLTPEQKTASYIIKGNKYYEKEKYRKALYFYLKAKKISRSDFSSNINCANANFMLRKLSKTIYYLRKIQENYPDNVKVVSLFALTYFEMQKYENSAEYYEKLTLYGSKNPWDYNHLSQCYQNMKRYKKALNSAWKALVLAKTKTRAHHLNFGYLLYEINLADTKCDTVSWAEKWLAEYPYEPIAQYMGNAIIGKSSPYYDSSRAIRAIFNAFAPEFEQTLNDLEYKTPQVIYNVLKTYNSKRGSTLDLGCGTGLCGKYLVKFTKANELYGVDISERMLAVAQKKHFYAKLFCSDIIDFLQNNDKKFDLIAAADVLTYFSDLNEVFLGVVNSLNDKGCFVFSISITSENEDFVLHSSGRNLHSSAYITKLAKIYGFTIRNTTNCIIRKENNKPVRGCVFLLQKK